MSPEIVNCLVNEMKISWDHFEKKHFSFSTQVKSLIDSKLLKMFEISGTIKAGNTVDDDFNTHYYEDGDELTNEFLQAMFDCFKEWQKSEGIQLQKNLYAHTNRNTDNWFPLVIIEDQINKCTYKDELITVYRGTNQNQFDSKIFQQRQSWATDLAVAKVFAFNHPSGSTCLEDRVVIEAVVKTSDVLWERTAEAEMVLRLGFSPMSAFITMDYDDYKKQQ